MDYSKRLVKGTFLIFISGTLAALLSYLLRLFLARTFSVEEYGLIYAIVALFSFFSIFVGLGMNSSLIRFATEFKFKKQFDKIKNSIIIIAIFQFLIALFISIIFIIFSKQIAEHYLHSKDTFVLIILFALFFILNPLFNLLKESFRVFKKIKFYSLADVLYPASILLLTLILVSVGLGLYSVFIAHIISIFFLIIFFYFLFTKKVFPKFTKLRFEFDYILTKKLFKFGFPLLMAGTFGIVYGKIDTILISLFLSLRDVGLYSAAYPTVGAMWGIASALIVVLFPLVSEMWIKKEFNKIRKGLDKLYTYSLLVVFPVTLILFLFPEVVLNVLFGEKFASASSVLRILSFAIVLQVLIKINNTFLISIDLPKYSAKYTIYGGIMNLGGNLLLIPVFGINGAAVSTLLAFCFILFCSTFKLSKSVNLRLNWFNYFKIIFAGFLLAVFISVTKRVLQTNVWLELFLVLTLGLLFYLFLIVKLKLVKIKEIKHIFKLLVSK
tara:strand:+ start:85 stop:1575 length:1491 start_codon:yes stop_codon:yes gene_type:complete